MINIAQSEEEYNKCIEYLNSKNANILSGTYLYYILNDNKEIICVAGYNKEFGSAIEPLYSDSNTASRIMLSFMQGLIFNKGFNTVRARTLNETVKNILLKLGFINYNEYEFIYYNIKENKI